MSDSLIGLIYDAAVKPERWPELLESLALSLEKHTRNPAQQLLRRTQHEVDLLSDVANLVDRQDRLGLLHHFGQALTIAEKVNRVSEQRDSLLSLIDRLPSGVLLVDAEANISVMNRQAGFLLQEHHGIESSEGRIVCSFRGDTHRLHELIKELSVPKAVLSVARGIAIKCRSSDEPTISCSLIPLRQSTFAGYDLADASVALFINSESFRSNFNSDAVRQVYGLTRAETNVLERLVLGHSIREIADGTYKSVETVRSQVRSLFSKTRTHRQGELIGLVLSDPVNSLNDIESTEQDDQSIFDFQKTLAAPESSQCRRITLRDGRILAYEEYGKPDGTPVFFCHSAKGCRFQIPPIDARLQQLNIRLIVPDRPGIGFSDPLPGRTLYQWADDLEELADRLGIDDFHISGHSTGGTYALAVAHKMPERVLSMLLIGAGINPGDSASLEGMLPTHKMVFYLACNAPPIYREFMKLMSRGILQDPEHYIERMSDTLCKKDVETFKDPLVRECFLKASFECARQGTGGSTQDLLFWASVPEFAYSEVMAPTTLWHGELDQNIPLHLAKSLAEQLPIAKLKIVSGSGHMMFYEVLGDALEELLMH